MKRFIQKLRAKPEAERKHLLHVSTFVCAILLVVMWSISLGASFRSPDLKVRAQQDLQPLKDLGANVIDGYNVITDDPASDNKAE